MLYHLNKCPHPLLIQLWPGSLTWIVWDSWVSREWLVEMYYGTWPTLYRSQTAVQAVQAPSMSSRPLGRHSVDSESQERPSGSASLTLRFSTFRAQHPAALSLKGGQPANAHISLLTDNFRSSTQRILIGHWFCVNPCLWYWCYNRTRQMWSLPVQATLRVAYHTIVWSQLWGDSVEYNDGVEKGPKVGWDMGRCFLGVEMLKLEAGR